MKYNKIIILIIIALFIFIFSLTFDNNGQVIFTDTELKWMQDHPIIYVAPDPTFGPIEFFDEAGQYEGAAADYIDWIESNTPLTFEIIKYDNWSDILIAIQSYEIDMLGAATKTIQREAYLKFTEPYFTVPNVVITRDDYEGKVILNSLSGKTVLVIKDYAMDDYLESDYPDIDIVRVDTIEEGLGLVSLGTYDYMAVSIAQVSYYLPGSSATNLKVSGDAELKYDLSFAVRDDYEILQTILDKALEVMPNKVKDSIYDRWIEVDFSKGVSKKVFYILIIVLITILALMALVIFFNRVLKISVEQKTKALSNELKERKKIEINLAELNNHLEKKVMERTNELSEAFDNLKLVQKELIESEKMASLSRVLVNISHNLNTPIGSSITLVSYDDVVINKIETAITNVDILSKVSILKESNHMIYDELLKAKTFLDQIKKLSDVSVTNARKTMDLKDYLVYLINSYEVKFEAAQISLNLECDEDIKMLVSVGELDNIFRNLINNSLEYGFDNKSDGLIEIIVNKNNSNLEIIYRDNGNGIDASIQENIFDPLVTSNMGRTSGWGLSILYNTVKLALEGHVECHSEVLCGVEFAITLPI